MTIVLVSPCSLSLLMQHLPALAEAPATLPFATVGYLADALIRRGHQVRVVTCSPHLDQTRRFVGAALTVDVVPWRQRGWQRAWDQFRPERDALAAAIRNGPADVVHAHWTYEFALAALACDKPTLITAHDNPWQVLSWYRHPYRLARLLMARQVAKRASVMTGVSPYVEQHWRRWMGYRGQFAVVPNGLPADRFVAAPRSIPADAPPVLMATLTGWDRRKNGTTLIHAFARIHRQRPNARLVLYGEGHGPGEPAEACARAAGCLEAVILRGRRPYDEVQRALREEATIYVHPSREECHSLAIVEAMAAGLPVIGGTGCGGTPWTLDNGRAGLLTNVSDPTALADAILTLLTNPDRRHQLQKAGLHHARSHFTIDAVTDGYTALYRTLAR